MDVELLSRIQFAVTVGFHFLFPPISIGLALMLTVVEYQGWKKNDEEYVRLGKFFSKILAITFAVGVASGLVMVLQFGTNWARYSAFVGDVFGAPLAAEAVFAFFLESTFLGLYLFGRNKVSKGVHWFSILMVFVGSLISAFFIIVANSWQQTPAGFGIQNLTTGALLSQDEISKMIQLGKGFDPATHRAVLTDFFAALFNASTLPRFFHTVLAAFITGAFALTGVSAYLVLKNKSVEVAKKGVKLGVSFGFIFSILQLFPVGHEHAKQVAHTQPEKFAATQGLYTSETGAPIMIFAYPVSSPPPELKAKIEIPGMLSWLAFGDFNAKIRGLNEFPPENIPPLWMTFVSYHNMVALGMFFIFVTLLGVIQLKRKKLYDSKKLLKIFMWSIPLPVIACQFGWVAAEVGRQPWIVYGLLRTKDSFTNTVSLTEVWISFILFAIVYIVMTFAYLWLIFKEIKHGPEPAEIINEGKEVTV